MGRLQLTSHLLMDNAGGSNESMDKTLQARVHLKVAELQLPLHENFIPEFLNSEDHSRDLLGKHWQDKTISDQSKMLMLQSIDYQFPCAKVLRLWGLRENKKCRLCKRSHLDVTPWPEIHGYIKTQCPVLRKPRITVHHGIWCELLTAISRNSLEAHDNGKRKWYFLSAVSEATHDKWTFRQILVHLGLFSGIRQLNDEIITFYAQQNIVSTSEEITSFYGQRPDGAPRFSGSGGLRENKKCRICKRSHLDVTPWPQIHGYIKTQCPVLRKPRIAVHHGIWCELMMMMLLLL